MKIMSHKYVRAAAVAVFALAIVGAVPATHAEGYIGLDGSSINVDSSVEDDINPRGLRLRLGLRLNELFDIEAHVGGGRDGTTTAFEKFSTTYYGVYLKGYLPVGRRSALFFLAGGAGVEFTQNLDTGKFSDDRNGLSYGIGLETQLSKYVDLSADFIQYTLSDDQFSDASAVNLGVKLYF